MIIIVRSKEFKKKFGIMSEKLKRKTLERISIFVADQFDVILNNHQLHGEYDGCRSINITGDLRLIYKKIDAETYILLDLGNHHQLYD